PATSRAFAALCGGLTSPRPAGRHHRSTALVAAARRLSVRGRRVNPAFGGAETSWSEAFPHWEPVADQVPVGPEESVHGTRPEDRVETGLEIASTYQSVGDFSLGELYPLVP